MTPEVIEDFKNYLDQAKITYDTAKFNEALNEIKGEIRREIFFPVVSPEEGVKISRQADPVVLKAIEVMPEAAGFLK